MCLFTGVIELGQSYELLVKVEVHKNVLKVMQSQERTTERGSRITEVRLIVLEDDDCLCRQ